MEISFGLWSGHHDGGHGQEDLGGRLQLPGTIPWANQPDQRDCPV